MVSVLEEEAASTAPPATPPDEPSSSISDSSCDDDIAQKTLDIASATLAFSVVTVVGFIAYSYYASVVPNKQVIGKDGKWEEAQNPMSK